LEQGAPSSHLILRWWQASQGTRFVAAGVDVDVEVNEAAGESVDISIITDALLAFSIKTFPRAQQRLQHKSCLSWFLACI